MEDTAKPKRWRLLPVILIAGVVYAYALIWRSSRQPGEFIASVPVPSHSEVVIHSVPPESDGVCLSTSHTSKPGKREHWIADVSTGRLEKLSIPRQKTGTWVCGWGMKGNVLCYSTDRGIYSVPRTGGMPRFLTYLPSDTWASRNGVLWTTGRSNVSPASRGWVLNLQSGGKASLPLPFGCRIGSGWKGNMKTPFILSVEIPDPLGHVHWQLWLVDRRGQNSRKLTWPGSEPRGVALDGTANLFVLEKSNLWVYSVASSSPRKVTGFSPEEIPLCVDGTIDGVCVRALRISRGRAWLNWAAGMLSTSGVVKRETLMKSPLAPFLKIPTDVWYMTVAGGPRTRILCQVDAFATSPESDTVYFVRGRELRRLCIPARR